MRRVVVGSVASVLLAAAAPLANAAQRPRPTDVPPGQAVSEPVPDALQIYNDYATAALTYSSRRAAVHYVVRGVDAPPLNDDDSDGVPDYVERVGSAADVALDYFEKRGFATVLPDEAGPDDRPDLYVSRLAPGYFGVAYPAVQARGGAFVVVSNALDPSPERSLGSLYGTVAHELFHLVQFSYFPPTVEPAIPDWVLEGSAAAMENRVYPQLEDIVGSLQLRGWLDRPQASLTAQTYGSQLLWRYLDERRPGLLPRYLRRLAERRPVRSAAVGLAATWARVSAEPFSAAFARFAAWVAGEYADRITPLRTLAAGDRSLGRVGPLSIHFLRLARSSPAVRFRATGVGMAAALVYEQESVYAGRAAVTRRIPGREVDGAVVFRIPAGLRRSPRFRPAMLVVANGDPARPRAYSVVVAPGAPNNRVGLRYFAGSRGFLPWSHDHVHGRAVRLEDGSGGRRRDRTAQAGSRRADGRGEAHPDPAFDLRPAGGNVLPGGRGRDGRCRAGDRGPGGDPLRQRRRDGRNVIERERSTA